MEPSDWTLGQPSKPGNYLLLGRLYCDHTGASMPPVVVSAKVEERRRPWLKGGKFVEVSEGFFWTSIYERSPQSLQAVTHHMPIRLPERCEIGE